MICNGIEHRFAVRDSDGVIRPSGKDRTRVLEAFYAAVADEDTVGLSIKQKNFLNALEATACAKQKNRQAYLQRASSLLCALLNDPEAAEAGVDETSSSSVASTISASNPKPIHMTSCSIIGENAVTQNVRQTSEALLRQRRKAKIVAACQREMNALVEYTKSASDKLGSIVRCPNRSCASNRKKDPLPVDIRWSCTQARSADEGQTDVWTCEHCGFEWQQNT